MGGGGVGKKGNGPGTSVGAQAVQGGGISPFQSAFGRYTFGQNALANAQAFNEMPMSTGQTQADVGAGVGWALQNSEMSDADAAAMASFINAQQNFNTQQQQQAKSAVSSGIGSLGSIAGGGGSSGGGGASGGF